MVAGTMIELKETNLTTLEQLGTLAAQGRQEVAFPPSPGQGKAERCAHIQALMHRFPDASLLHAGAAGHDARRKSAFIAQRLTGKRGSPFPVGL